MSRLDEKIYMDTIEAPHEHRGHFEHHHSKRRKYGPDCSQYSSVKYII